MDLGLLSWLSLRARKGNICFTESAGSVEHGNLWESLAAAAGGGCEVRHVGDVLYPRGEVLDGVPRSRGDVTTAVTIMSSIAIGEMACSGTCQHTIMMAVVMTIEHPASRRPVHKSRIWNLRASTRADSQSQGAEFLGPCRIPKRSRLGDSLSSLTLGTRMKTRTASPRGENPCDYGRCHETQRFSCVWGKFTPRNKEEPAHVGPPHLHRRGHRCAHLQRRPRAPGRRRRVYVQLPARYASGCS